MTERILQIARDYNVDLRADDPRFQRSVTVHHGDGSTFHFKYAFALELDEGDGWLFVFTEHNKFHVFSKGDLNGWWQYDRIPIEQFDGEVR